MICRSTATASQAIHYEHRSVSQPEQPIDDDEGVTGGSHRSCLRLAPPRRSTRRQGQQSRWRQQILPPPGLMVMPAQLLQDEQLTTIHKQPVPMYHHRSVSTSSSSRSHKSSSVASQLSTHEDPAGDAAAAAADTVSSSASASSSQQPLLLSEENGSGAPKATRPSIASLLTLPAPQDRSSKLQYERRKRLQQHGLQYEGELEPVGRRGEEAIAGGGGAGATSTTMTTTQQPSATALPHMRDFSAPPIVATLKKGSPMPPSRVRQTRQSTAAAAAASLFQALPDDDSDDDEQDLLPPEPARVTALSNPFASSSRNSPFVSPRSISSSNHSTTSSQSSTTSSSDADLAPLQINPATGQVVKGFRYVAQQAQQKSLLQPALTASSTQSEDDADHDAFLLSCSQRQALSEQPKQQRGHDRTTTSNHDKYSSSQDSSPTRAGAKCTRNHADSATTFASAPPSPSAVVVTSNIHSLNAQALAHVQNNEFDMALDCFSRVLVLLKDMHAQTNPNHPAIASCHHNLGTLHAKRAQAVAGEYLPDSAHQHYLRQLALSEFQAAARTARDGLGRNHPNVAVSLVRIGFLLLQSRQYQNAVTTFREALRIRVAAFGTTQHALVANLYNNLGVCHLHLGQFENGLEYLQAALDIQRHASSSLDTGNGDANMSSATTVSSSASNQHLIKETKWVQQLELADTLFNVGGLCLEWIRRQGPDTRRAMDAEDAFAEALEIRLKVLGPEDPMVLQVKALLDMARALPRPRLRSMSPGRSPRQDFIADSSPRSSNQHYEPDVTLPPIHLSPRSSYTTNQHASASTQPSEPGSTGSRPFDESSIRSRPSPMTPRALNRTPSEPEPTRHDCIFRTPPRNSAVAVVTPASDRIATKYNERYSNGVVSQPKSPRWLIPTGSKDEGDSQIIKNSTKVYLAPHIVPESPGRTTRQNPPTSHSVIFSTGNNERDELMNRVKALLDDNESIYAADSAAHQVTPERPTKPNQYPI